jgi:sec-independent protein translocase protein TatA
MPNIGPGELILILIIALVIIGPGRLPDVGSALGKSIREFRKASTDMAEATRVDTSPLPPPPAAPQPNVLSNPAPVSPPAAPAPIPQPPSPVPTAPTVPGPLAVPPTPPSDETTGQTS